jgi:hypothetical protein
VIVAVVVVVVVVAAAAGEEHRRRARVPEDDALGEGREYVLVARIDGQCRLQVGVVLEGGVDEFNVALPFLIAEGVDGAAGRHLPRDLFGPLVLASEELEEEEADSQREREDKE